MSRLTTIEIDKDYIKFSAAHFTIFSATERERLHGHNFKVSARFVAEVGSNGLCVDYSELKKEVVRICESLDEYTLIPKDSPFLTIREQGEYYHVHFADEVMIFLKKDTLLLPIRNTTIEEFSAYILDHIVADKTFQTLCPMKEIEIWVSSGPGQNGMTKWSAGR